MFVQRGSVSRSLAINFVRTLATYQDYDIDLITLRRTPKGTGLREFPDLAFLTDYEPPASTPLSYDVVKKSLNLQTDNPRFDFAVTYFYELTQFLKFVVNSYDSKIRSFDQFTTTEFLNSLYIFKDMYSKGKIDTNIEKDRFYKMFDGVLKIVSKYPEFPSYLTPQVFNQAKVLASTIDFFRSGAGSFIGELSCLSNELDFSAVSTAEVCRSIDATAHEFDAILLESDCDAFFTESFWSCFIQVHRYKRLRDILKSCNIKPVTIARVLEDPSLSSITYKVFQLSGAQEKLDSLKLRFNPYVSYIFAASPSSNESHWENFSSFASLLCSNLAESTDDLVYTFSKRILISLMPQFCNGTVKDHEFKDMFDYLAPSDWFLFDDSFQSNYELNAVFESGLYRKRLGLQILRYHFGEKFEQASFLGEDVNKLLNSLSVNAHLVAAVEDAIMAICHYEQACPWNSAVIDKLLDDPTICAKLDTAYEWFESDRSLGDIDLRHIKANESEETKPAVDMSKFTTELAEFKAHDLCNFPYSLFLPGQLCAILDSQILEFQMDSYDSSSAINDETILKYKELLAAFEGLSQSDCANLDKYCGQPVGGAYLQIPDDSNIHEFVTELSAFKEDVLGGNNFSGYSRNDLLDLYASWVNHRHSDSIPHLRLQRSLEALLRNNGGYTFVLDSIINSHKVFAEVEKSIKAKSNYVQIPDELELHKFTNELCIVKNVLLKGQDFKSVTLIELLQSLLNALADELLVEIQDKLFNFMRLEGRLRKLFAINGGYVAILDTLLHSQSVFENLDKTVSDKTKAMDYKQIPDDFLLEDYIVDLMQLRTEIGSSFKDSDASSILAKLALMATMEKKFNLEKRLILRKLYRVLSVLFKHNGNQTFILDNVILNGEVFGQFEGRKKGPTNVSDLVARHFQLVRNYEYLLRDICAALGDPIKVNFNEKLQEFSKGRSKYERPLINDLIRELSALNLQIKHYPLLLTKLVNAQVKSVDEAQKIFDNHLTSIANIRDTSSVDMFDESGARIVASNLDKEPKLNKYNLQEFIGGESSATTKPKYSNIDDLMSSVSKSRSEPDSFSEQMFGEPPSVRKAKADAKNRLAEEDPEEAKYLSGMTADDIRDNYNRRSVHKSKVEQFLKDAKEKQHLGQEQEFRANKAYEWSKSMCHSNRSLESHNFFNPLEVKKDAGKNKQYLLLTQDGQQVVSRENPLGPRHVTEDMYTILSRFGEKDAEKFIKSVNRLQRKHWRLIGGGEKGEKMMVFEREIRRKGGKWLVRLKSVLATAGALFVLLFGLDWYWTRPNSVSSVKRRPEPVPQVIQVEPPVVRESTIKESTPQQQPLVWKSLLWKSKD